MDRALWTAACLFGVLLSATEGTDSNRLRHRRNVVQFGNMIECRMNRQPLDYYGYGCHCGFGGKGAPVDPTDRRKERLVREEDLRVRSEGFCLLHARVLQQSLRGLHGAVSGHQAHLSMTRIWHHGG
ncbi:uncharacterized protein LOC116946960 isoform X2 [Petromyzon marinus]|uniref:uncharacterized protein LOC116946960 isoform X2 n=1 Tax=Petromyzon marinus TaxID=7757 RepID=UPI003F70F103